MPGKNLTRKKQTPDEMLKIVKILNSAYGGEVIEG